MPPEDIVGAFEIKNGQVVAASYRASPKHMILSANGFFRLTGSWWMTERAGRKAGSAANRSPFIRICDATSQNAPKASFPNCEWIEAWAEHMTT